MNKIRVIDLLNKIATGDIPEHIKKKSIDMYWNKENYCYDIKTENMYAPYYMFYYEELNNEIEVIEEPKKIEKLDLASMYLPSEVKVIDIELQNKINEIIDYINKGEE